MSNLDASGEAEQTGDGPNAEGPVIPPASGWPGIGFGGFFDFFLPLPEEGLDEWPPERNACVATSTS